MKCLFRATRRKVIPCGWVSNTYDHLPDCFDHQLWLILVDVMAAVPVARDGLDRVAAGLHVERATAAHRWGVNSVSSVSE